MDNLPTDLQEFEELEIAEEELIDAYVRDELSADERKLVKKGMLNSPHLVERIQFAKMLAKAASSASPQPISRSDVEVSVDQSIPDRTRTHWWKSIFGASLVPQSAFSLALGGCLFLVVLSGVVMFAGWMKLRSESQRLAALEQQKQELERQSADQRSRSEQLTAELQTANERREQDQKLIEELKRTLNQNDQSNSQATPSTFASILLLPGLTRDGGGGADLVVSPSSSKIRIRFALETAEYPSYRVVIKNSQGIQITKTGLKPRGSRAGKVLVLEVPVSRLPPGDYTVDVSGITPSGVIDPIHDYAFRVRRRQE